MAHAYALPNGKKPPTEVGSFRTDDVRLSFISIANGKKPPTEVESFASVICGLQVAGPSQLHDTPCVERFKPFKKMNPLGPSATGWCGAYGNRTRRSRSDSPATSPEDAPSQGHGIMAVGQTQAIYTPSSSSSRAASRIAADSCWSMTRHAFKVFKVKATPSNSANRSIRLIGGGSFPLSTLLKSAGSIWASYANPIWVNPLSRITFRRLSPKYVMLSFCNKLTPPSKLIVDNRQF